ncbi:hypothetical protein EW146_g7986 [Bondarzewia mesenterica]|uniref:SET domain-containing protein n=1 Tax=Bondarzewia mesenterica TaxID=1095465 RepID=A0A4S4LI26_9AGAM|nr:hypothetical protein EW146_g7986 [Bondarzewia mesenterica]
MVFSRFAAFPASDLLSATQLISLHLLLNRPPPDGESPDHLFGPYISVLPREFDSHPLTWAVQHKFGGPIPLTSSGENLLPKLPCSVLSALTKLEAKFWDDWKTVCQYVGDSLDLLDRSDGPLKMSDTTDIASTTHYLWAWMNVNTRCLYDRLTRSKSDPDNISLCPVFDFANHKWTAPTMRVAPSDVDVRNFVVRDVGSNLTCVTCCEDVVEDKELYLTYGEHPNRTLFVEYGFINEVSEHEFVSGAYAGEVDVQDIVEDIDWTMHSAPQPAHPSYRLITALRLYHIVPADSHDVPSDNDTILNPWSDTLSGRKDVISDENEAAWRSTLLNISNTVAKRAEASMASMAGMPMEKEQPEWYEWMLHNIRMLWWEERYVAMAVADSVRNGVEF